MMQNIILVNTKIIKSFGLSTVLLILILFTMGTTKFSNAISPVGGKAPGTEEVVPGSPESPVLPASPSEETSASFNYLEPMNYVHIGCDYFIRSFRLDANGYQIPVLLPWKYSHLKRDFSANLGALAKIPRFLGMGSFPSHLNFKESVGYLFNTYCPLGWELEKGSWGHIDTMLHHIFGEQYEYSLDYLEILYVNPTQNLPILLLVSEERNTGKTTFLNFLKAVFGPNMVFVTNDTIGSKFNSDRAGKLIMACDETFINKKEDSERLKALSTARQSYIEMKGKDRYEIDNFIKIVLCSNNVFSPVYIDFEETRYWVREVPSLQSDDPHFIDAMKEEIPAFLHFIVHRQLFVSEAKSRMWFHPADLRTPALLRIMKACRPSAEMELAEFLLELMDEYRVNVLQYTMTDLCCSLKAGNHDIKNFHHIISKVWNVPQAGSKMAYDYYANAQGGIRRYGRYYTFERPFLEGLLPSVTPSTPADTASSLKDNENSIS